jgi:hypothetical protein
LFREAVLIFFGTACNMGSFRDSSVKILMIAARRAFCFFVSAMISPANPPGTKNATLGG